VRLPPIIHNRISYAGATIGLLALIVFGFLLVLHTVTDAAQAPYAGLVIFVAVPAVLLFGVSLIPVGMLVEWRRVRRTGKRSLPEFPVVNLNDPRQLNATVIFAVGSLILLFLTVFGSFEAYEATESVVFCGALCHTPMHPEYTTYQNSAHARVRCVDCHVGPGADWFVKSKVSGLYQVYAVLFNKVPRPIPVPIESLRPAQQTCEQCHWPEHFFYAQERRLVHYLADADNTRWDIHLLIKTGGGDPALLQSGGIHWHMNIENRVEYIATDAQRQVIPWVRITNTRTGKATTYQSAADPLTEQQVAQATIRRMDCMDCHNRPTHIFRSPSSGVNLAMAVGRIDATLPSIKQTGVDLLATDYASTPHALRAIDDGVRQFYQDSHPEVLRTRAETVTQAIGELQTIYQRNFFPDMKSRWDVYPDNIGHFIFPGCFRCHDNNHTSEDGKVISKTCTACHVITAQGKASGLAFAASKDGLPFEHPVDIGDMWNEMPCNDCHKGTVP
jgi:NapC/NirT cytochrome c family protein